MVPHTSSVKLFFSKRMYLKEDAFDQEIEAGISSSSCQYSKKTISLIFPIGLLCVIISLRRLPYMVPHPLKS